MKSIKQKNNKQTLKSILFSTFLGTLLSFFPDSEALADYCKVASGTPGSSVTGTLNPALVTMPVLVGDISVMPSMPIGSVIYRQRFVPTFEHISGWECQIDKAISGGATSATNWNLVNTPMGGVAYSFGEIDQVFPTNIPGIGVAVLNRWLLTGTMRTLPAKSEFKQYYTGKVSGWSPGDWSTMELVLVKTGTIPTGTSNVIQASSFPTFAYEVGIYEIGPLLRSMTLGFSGQINIVSKTCQTSDVIVDLDEHQKVNFTGVGTTTAWTNFDITLTDCPAFFGSYSRATGESFNTANVTWNDKGASSVGPATHPNYINFTLNPINGLVSLSNGHNGIELDSGADKATGLAIEIATNTGSAINYGTETHSNLALTTADGASYTIPFKARYHQTDSTVTTGDANASVEFVINYY